MPDSPAACSKTKKQTRNTTMAVEETTTESWGSRLGGSIKGVLAGAVLFIAGIPLLFWNEGRTVKTTQALEEGAANCTVVPSADTVDAANEGKLIHITGTAATEDILTDELFSGISTKGMQLSRKVEYYQWVEDSKSETKKNVGGSTTTKTTYTYSKKWVSSPEDSSEFKEAGHENTVFFAEAEDSTQYAQQATLGAFSLTSKQISSISGQENVKLEGVQWPEALKGRTTVSGNTLYIGRAANPMQAAIAEKGAAPQLPVEQGYLQIENEPGKNLLVVQDGGLVYVQSSMGDLYQLVGDANGTPMVQLRNGALRNVTGEAEMVGPAPTFPYQIPASIQVERLGECPVVCIGTYAYVRTSDNRLLNIKPYQDYFVVTDNGVMRKANIMLAPTAVGDKGTADPSAPQVGDVRITWTYVGPQKPVSIVAVQTGNTFAPYVSQSSGYKVDMLSNGIKTKEEMFQNAESANTTMAWILRFVGWLIMYIGLGMIFKPLSVLGDVLPILGDLVGVGTGILSFLISAAVALIVIAIAWVFYRPVLGIILLAIGIGLIVLLIKKKKSKKAAAPAAE